MRALIAGWLMRKRFRGAMESAKRGHRQESLDLVDFHIWAPLALIRLTTFYYQKPVRSALFISLIETFRLTRLCY